MKKKVLISAVVAIMLSSCADPQHHLHPYMLGEECGFWSGLWHGIIAPISFIGSLLSDNVEVWAVNNNGGWYSFGFVLGIGGFFKGVKATK